MIGHRGGEEYFSHNMKNNHEMLLLFVFPALNALNAPLSPSVTVWRWKVNL
jgi:hypothetical protein